MVQSAVKTGFIKGRGRREHSTYRFSGLDKAGYVSEAERGDLVTVLLSFNFHLTLPRLSQEGSELRLEGLLRSDWPPDMSVGDVLFVCSLI